MKTTVLTIVIVYLVVINIYSLLQMGRDKRYAIEGKRRIPERTLFLTALIGGSVGSILGMYAFRHKTKHTNFVVGMPAILIAQLVVAFMLKGMMGM